MPTAFATATICVSSPKTINTKIKKKKIVFTDVYINKTV